MPDFLSLSGVDIVIVLVIFLGESVQFGTDIKKLFMFLWGNGFFLFGGGCFFLDLGVPIDFGSNFVNAWQNLDIKTVLSDCRGNIAHSVPDSFVLQVLWGFL